MKYGDNLFRVLLETKYFIFVSKKEGVKKIGELFFKPNFFGYALLGGREFFLEPTLPLPTESTKFVKHFFGQFCNLI